MHWRNLVSLFVCVCVFFLRIMHSIGRTKNGHNSKCQPHIWRLKIKKRKTLSVNDHLQGKIQCLYGCTLFCETVCNLHILHFVIYRLYIIYDFELPIVGIPFTIISHDMTNLTIALLVDYIYVYMLWFQWKWCTLMYAKNVSPLYKESKKSINSICLCFILLEF